MSRYTHNEIHEWISTLDDERSRLAGMDIQIGQCIAYVSHAQASGYGTERDAAHVLDILYRLADIVKLARKWSGWLRRPPAEVEILVSLGREKP